MSAPDEKRARATAQGGRVAASRKNATCLECATAFAATRRGEAFCCKACRGRHRSRRNARGAQFYDLFMALRYERDDAKRLKVWTALTRMAQRFKEEDDAERDGRRSWRKVSEVYAANVWLHAIVSQIRAGR